MSPTLVFLLGSLFSFTGFAAGDSSDASPDSPCRTATLDPWGSGRPVTLDPDGCIADLIRRCIANTLQCVDEEIQKLIR